MIKCHDYLQEQIVLSLCVHLSCFAQQVTCSMRSKVHPYFLEVARHGGYYGGAAALFGLDFQGAVKQRR